MNDDTFEDWTPEIIPYENGLCIKIKKCTILCKGKYEYCEIYNQDLDKTKIENFFKPVEYYGDFGSDKAMERHEIMKPLEDVLNDSAKKYWFEKWMKEDFKEKDKIIT